MCPYLGNLPSIPCRLCAMCRVSSLYRLNLLMVPDGWTSRGACQTIAVSNDPICMQPRCTLLYLVGSSTSSIMDFYPFASQPPPTLCYKCSMFSQHKHTFSFSAPIEP
ncbi:hypothetical protein KP509_1Z178700 [Ceratopteris richardii]|nr:hypothetical protein KP509_1Z178700 [Ceratopteris richardii]